MKPSDSPWILLDLVARDLASVLEGESLPRDRRPEARRLLMAAWLLLKGRRTAAARKAALTLARRLDGLVAGAMQHGSAGSGALPRTDRLGIADRLLASPRSPLQERLSALEGSIDALARKTLRMVEHAEAEARRAGVAPRHAGSTPAEGGRQNLELVWGETES